MIGEPLHLDPVPVLGDYAAGRRYDSFLDPGIRSSPGSGAALPQISEEREVEAAVSGRSCRRTAAPDSRQWMIVAHKDPAAQRARPAASPGERSHLPKSGTERPVATLKEMRPLTRRAAEPVMSRCARSGHRKTCGRSPIRLATDRPCRAVAGLLFAFDQRCGNCSISRGATSGCQGDASFSWCPPKRSQVDRFVGSPEQARC